MWGSGLRQIVLLLAIIKNTDTKTALQIFYLLLITMFGVSLGAIALLKKAGAKK